MVCPCKGAWHDKYSRKRRYYRSLAVLLCSMPAKMVLQAQWCCVSGSIGLCCKSVKKACGTMGLCRKYGGHRGSISDLQ